VKDEREGTVGGGSPDVERELGRLMIVPVPPGLRQRVLDRAAEARCRTVLTPGLRRLAIAAAALIIAVLVADPILSRHEAVRMSALLDGRTAAAAAPEVSSELAEALGGQASGLDQLARLRTLARAAAGEASVRDLVTAHERLKGWLNHETSEDLN